MRSTITGARPRLSSSTSSSLGRRASARECEHLLLAAREQPGATVAQLAQSGEVAVRVLGVEALTAMTEAKVLADGELEEDAAALGDAGDARACDLDWRA